MNPFIRWIANILPSCKTQQASRCQSDSGWAQNETLHTWNLEQSKDSHRQLQCARKTLPDERDLVMGRINTWLLLMSPHTLHHLVQARRLSLQCLQCDEVSSQRSNILSEQPLFFFFTVAMLLSMRHSVATGGQRCAKWTGDKNPFL